MIMKPSLLCLIAVIFTGATLPATTQAGLLDQPGTATISLKYSTPFQKEEPLETLVSCEVSGSQILLPLLRPNGTSWLCRLSIDESNDQLLANISVIDPSTLVQTGTPAISVPMEVIGFTKSFKSGEAFEVIKTTHYSISLALTLTPRKATPVQAQTDNISSGNKVEDLTPEELKALDLKMQISNGQLFVTGYNPLPVAVRNLTIRIKSPSVKGSDAIDRVYALNVNGNPKDDLSATRNVNVQFPEGVQPVMTVEKVQVVR